jgi:2-keto-4-pentenoate hydratase/2-oxohepta-3-ene-1,7-dioic acid hydratase in catechol pathway
MASTLFKRLVRFVPRSNNTQILIGQPLRDDLDVGTALRKGSEVAVDVFSGSSVLNPGKSTGSTEIIDRVLSPLAASEVGTIRCIGLNYKQHADELGMALPSLPTLFM